MWTHYILGTSAYCFICGFPGHDRARSDAYTLMRCKVLNQLTGLWCSISDFYIFNTAFDNTFNHLNSTLKTMPSDNCYQIILMNLIKNLKLFHINNLQLHLLSYIIFLGSY